MAVFEPLTSNYASQLFSVIGEKLYLNSELADVHFVFESNGERERVPAHKAHLMAVSDVFATMFNGSWKEKDEVIISDMSVTAFKQFLQFFYFGQVKLTMEHIGAVMNLGEMYNVAECLAVCSKFVKNNLNDENVCRNYGLAILYNQQHLKQSCETVIGINTNAVFKSTGFLSCDRKVLTEILKLEWLSCTEVDLFEACMSWVKLTGENNELTKELVQSQLGDLFYNFRFGSMSLQEFATLIPTYGQFFAHAELAEIIQINADKEFQPTFFNEIRDKRCDSNLWNQKTKIVCNRLLSKYISIEPYFFEKLETTKFFVNEPLLLTKFATAYISEYRDGKYIGCGDVASDITIVEVSDLKNSKKELVQYVGKVNLRSTTTTEYDLPEPILIRPGLMYEIRLKQNPPEKCAIGTLLKCEVQMDDEITVQFHDDPLLPDDISHTGLIFGLNFYRIN